MQDETRNQIVSIEQIQQVIDYLEAHLLEELTLKEIAEQFYINSTTLNMMFRLTTGFTIMEYVKNRRLTLAGQELLTTRNTILTIALTYQYETPEAFTKAFVRMYGFPPSMVRRFDPVMKQFAPIQFQVQIHGGWREGTMLTDSIASKQENKTGMRYHITTKAKGGYRMKKQYIIQTKEMKQEKDWAILLKLTGELKKTEILYKIDGKTMLFAHGFEFPLEKICFTFLRSEEESVKRFFGTKTATRQSTPSFRYFDVNYDGMKVRCMFYGSEKDPDCEEYLYRNVDMVEVDGSTIPVQSLEFYYENAKPDDFLYEEVKDYLNK